jgi:hypothetical protein
MAWCRYQSWLHINHTWQCRDVNISDCCTSTIRDNVVMSISVMNAHQLIVTMSWCRHLDIVTDGWYALMTDIDISTLSRVIDVQSWLISTSRHRHGWLMCSQDLYWRLYIVMDGWCAIMTAIDVSTLSRMVDVQSCSDCCTSTIRDNVVMQISVMSAHQPSVTMSWCRYQW